METFIELSFRHCSGKNKLLPDQENFMRNFILDLPKAAQILKQGKINYQVMVCFNALTREKIRTGEYFGIQNSSIEEDIQKSKRMAERSCFFQQILVFLSDIPNHEQLSHKNLYLSVLGTMLANYINFCQKEEYSDFFIEEIIKNIAYKQNNHPLIHIYEVTKVIECTFEELGILQRNYTPPYLLYKNIWNFILQYAPRLSELLVQAFWKLSEIIANCETGQIVSFFEVIRRIITSFHNCIQNLNNLLGLDQIFKDDKSEPDEIIPQLVAIKEEQQHMFRQFFGKLALVQWNFLHVCKNAQSICSMLPKLITSPFPEHSKDTSLCLIINLLQNYLRIILKAKHLFKNGQINIEGIQGIILHSFLLPYIANVLNTQAEFDNSIKQTNQNITASILRILEQITEYLIAYGINHQNGNRGQQSQEDGSVVSAQEKSIIQYCQLCMQESIPNYNSAQDCVFILSLRVIQKLKFEKLQFLYRKYGRQEEMIEKISNFYEKKVKVLFKRYIFQKLIIPVNTPILTLQQQEQNNDIINYQEYIKCTLEEYFKQLIIYGPKFMESAPVIKNDQYEDSFLDQQLTQIYPKFFLFDDDSFEDNFDESRIEQAETSHTNQERCQEDYHAFLGFIQNLKRQYKRIIPEIVKSPSFNNYINSQILPLLVCLYHLLNSIPNSSMKHNILSEYFQLINTFEEHEPIPPVNKIQLSFCQLYLIDKFMQEIMPGEYVKEGPLASDFTMMLENEEGKNYIEFVLESLQNVSALIYENPFKKYGTTKIGEYDGSEELFQDLVSYGLTVFEEIAIKLSERAQEIEDEVNLNDETEDCEDLLNFIYDTIKDLQYLNSLSNFKLYSLAGLLINIFSSTFVFEIYRKIREQALKENLNLPIYFSGMTGLLKHCHQQSKLQTLIELSLQDLFAMISSNMLQDPDEETLQVLVPFLKYAFSDKVFKSPNDQISLRLQELFYPILIKILPEALMQPQIKKIAEEVYINFNSMNNFFVPLLPLTPNYNYPRSILSVYFENMERVPPETLEILPKYAHKKIDYLIQMLNFCIQNKEDLKKSSFYGQIISMIGFGDIVNNFYWQKWQKIEQLMGCIHYFMPSRSVEDLKQVINEKIGDFLAKRQEQVAKIMEFKSVKSAQLKNLNSTQNLIP